MCKCNECGRTIKNDYDICEFCYNKDRLFRQELMQLIKEYGNDVDTFNREYRKLQFKFNNCK